MISICFVSALTTSMNSFGKLFFTRMRVALRASVRCSIWIDPEEVDLMLLSHPLQQIEKLTKSGIQGMFSQHPPGHCLQVQVLNEHHANTFLGTQMVSQFELPILPNSSDVVVESGNLDSSFLTVLRTLFRSGILTLQQFQLAVQGCQESRSSNKLFIRGCQKLGQSQVDTQGISMRLSVRYRHIRLNCYYNFPPISFPQYPCLFNHKPLWDRSMQVDRHLPNFGQAYLPSRNGVDFELRKQHGLDLSKLLEARKAKPPRLKIIPSLMQSANGSLQNLRRGFAQQRKRFLRFGKFVLLNVIGREWLVGWNDVFSLQRTIISTTFTRIDPIFDFSQGVVINLARNFQPMKHRFFLVGVGINSVAVVQDRKSGSA